MFKVIEGWGDFESLYSCDGLGLVAEFASESVAIAFSESYYESQIAPDSDGFSMSNWKSYFVIVRGDDELQQIAELVDAYHRGRI